VKLIEYAREHRKRPTREEGTVWRWLRDRRFGALKFRRQHPMAGYILDFYCPELNLAIEIDGRGHVADFNHEIYDLNRDIELSKLGVTVLRVLNEDVRKRSEFVADRILATVEKLAPSPGLRPPSPARGRGL
jgi:very-short-patch-repair endonuclease